MKKLKITLTAFALLFSIGGTVLANVKTNGIINEPCRTANGTILPTVPSYCTKTNIYCCTGVTTGRNYFWN